MTVQVNTERKLVEVSYDVGDSETEFINVTAVGEADDVHTTGDRPNSGLAVLAYPSDFHGKSYITITDTDGETLDEGEITV